MMTAPEPMLTPPEVAEILRVQVATLATWRWLEKGPAWHKAGRVVRYCPSDIREYMRNTRRG
jgi:predicted DNA-binding transcriptional regulator AlpA